MDNEKQAESPAHSPLTVLVTFFQFSPISLKVLADIFLLFLLGSGMCQCCSLEDVSLLQSWVGKHWRKLYLWGKIRNRLFCTDLALTLPSHVSMRIEMLWNRLEEKKLNVRNRQSNEVIRGNVIMLLQTLKHHFLCFTIAFSIMSISFHTRGRSWNFKELLGSIRAFFTCMYILICHFQICHDLLRFCLRALESGVFLLYLPSQWLIQITICITTFNH